MIIVAGAGPAGLAAAVVAARAGFAVTVVEAASVVGGMTASYEIAGQRVDHGSHRLHPVMSAAVEGLIGPLLGDDLQVRARHGRVRISDRWLGFPLRTGELVRGLPMATAARMTFDAIAAPVRRATTDSFAEFVRAGLGPTVLEVFYGPYARKLWGRPPEELSAEIARRRITTSSPLAMARRLARTRSAGGKAFLYPRQGFGQIADRLAAAAVAEGVDLVLGSPVGSVRASDTGVEVEAGGKVLHGSSLLSTLPLGVLLAALGEVPPPIEHRGLVLAHLVVEGRRWTEFDAHYFAGPDALASRFSEPKNYRDAPDDPADVSVICAEIPVSLGDEWWDTSPADVRDRLLDDFDRVGLPVPRVAETVVRRVDRVYPVYGPGEDPLGSAEALLGRHRNVVSFGRGGRVNADNTHHAIDMGIGAAHSLDRAGYIDVAEWRAHCGRFAHHVVED